MEKNMVKIAHYANLKTIDGDEVNEYSKDEFEDMLSSMKVRKVKKSDRTLYFVKDNIKLNGIKLYRDDYFEVLDNQ
jgi:hypothetical protein